MWLAMLLTCPGLRWNFHICSLAYSHNPSYPWCIRGKPQQSSRQFRYPRIHSQHYFRSRYQWTHPHTHLEQLPLCWQTYLLFYTHKEQSQLQLIPFTWVVTNLAHLNFVCNVISAGGNICKYFEHLLVHGKSREWWWETDPLFSYTAVSHTKSQGEQTMREPTVLEAHLGNTSHST